MKSWYKLGACMHYYRSLHIKTFMSQRVRYTLYSLLIQLQLHLLERSFTKLESATWNMNTFRFLSRSGTIVIISSKKSRASILECWSSKIPQVNSCCGWAEWLFQVLSKMILGHNVMPTYGTHSEGLDLPWSRITCKIKLLHSYAPQSLYALVVGAATNFVSLLPVFGSWRVRSLDGHEGSPKLFTAKLKYCVGTIVTSTHY